MREKQKEILGLILDACEKNIRRLFDRDVPDYDSSHYNMAMDSIRIALSDNLSSRINEIENCVDTDSDLEIKRLKNIIKLASIRVRSIENEGDAIDESNLLKLEYDRFFRPGFCPGCDIDIPKDSDSVFCTKCIKESYL